MKDVLLICFFVCLSSIVWASSDDDSVIEAEDEDRENVIDVDNDNDDDDEDDDNGNDDGYDDGDGDGDGDSDGDGDGYEGKPVSLDAKDSTNNCWMTLNTKEHFKTLDKIDESYTDVRQSVQKSLEEKDFDNIMVNDFTAERGAAHREHYAHKDRVIPSGINLGGFCMMRMPESVLFFHRMKLRNNTYFHLEYLHNDLTNMMVNINLGLNDLHLMGDFERSLTDINPSILIYAPTFGQVQFLLKDVKYKIEGRYRVVKNRLRIELVSSNISCSDIAMTYINQAIQSSVIKIEQQNLGSFMSRMRIDLDLWLKDYFNDYLILDANMDGINVSLLSEYDKKKGAALEEFTDNSIKTIAKRIRRLKAQTIVIPSFTFKTIHSMTIKLTDGVLHGLDSMYRRSVATGYKQEKMRKVDSVVGFSNLKIVYKYEAWIPTGLPPLTGVLTLLANEVTAHLTLEMASESEMVNLNIEFLGQMKPESLTVEGAANLMISNYRHLLEHQIITLMSNNLVHGVKLLKTLPACEPFLPIPGQIPKEKGNQTKLRSSQKKNLMF